MYGQVGDPAVKRFKLPGQEELSRLRAELQRPTTVREISEYEEFVAWTGEASMRLTAEVWAAEKKSKCSATNIHRPWPSHPHHVARVG
jgi:hypothetical protein